MTDHIPLFSIGVPTYNRMELLRQSLLSLINQDFTDFEIIVGNDYLSEPITTEKIGITDDRIRIINNPVNLGELDNMNSLLKEARGQYFTWQFDDDLCSPVFLSEAFKALEKNKYPICVFSSFALVYGDGAYDFPLNGKSDMNLFSGREFLRLFLSGRIKALGSGGFYKTEYLNSIGGATKLSNGKMAVYSEYLMLFKSGLLENVAYINSKLVAFRVHGNSWSGTCAEAEIYKAAGINLIKESLPIFSDPKLRPDFEKNLSSLLRSVISMVMTKSRLAGIKISEYELNNYIEWIRNEFQVIIQPELQESSAKCLESVLKNIPIFKLKAWLKTKISINYLRYAHLGLSLISRYSNKSF